MTAEKLSDTNPELVIEAASVVVDSTLSPAAQVLSADLDYQGEFYVAEGHSSAEADRLKMMARMADNVSVSSMNGVLFREDVQVADIGAGDSTSLGEHIHAINSTAVYRPIDIRQEAVDGHLAAGFDAKVGSATDLPLPDNTIDAFHARFTFGWLDAAGRVTAVEEMVRAGKPDAQITLIDYDWTVAHGPAPMNDLIHKVTDVMRGFKFDPNYGAKLNDEISANENVRQLLRPGSEIEEQRTEVEQPISDSLVMIDATVRPLIEKLREMGMQQDAEEVELLANAVHVYGAAHPDEQVRFPDIVSVTFRLGNEEAHARIRGNIAMARAMGANTLRELSTVAVGPDKLGTFYLTSEDMITQARKLHAQAYHEHGYVTDAGIDQDGVLIEDIDPTETVAASTYVGILNEEGTVTGCIRMIESEDHTVSGLPTYQKIMQLAAAGKADLSDTPLADPAIKAYEGSALGKSSENIDRAATARLFLGIIEAGKQHSYKHAVIGVVDKAAKMMVAMFGEEAFRRIHTDEDVMIEGDGIKEGGVKLIPFYVDVDNFAANCRNHFAKRPFSAKVHGDLFEGM